MKKILIFEKRKKAKILYLKGMSIRSISKTLIAGRNNVSRWINLPDTEILIDNRGWKKHKLRKYTKEAQKQIRQIRRQLERENSFFIGSKVVQKNYENQTCKKISKSFIDKTLKEAK
jgi:transposase